MCGIAGFVGAGTSRDIRAMTDALAHRGPDDEGFYHDPATRLFLGHRRLAVIDIAGGIQPMWDEDGVLGVVFNGEIYNHRRLRRELEELGCLFRTDHSDTEVLIHGYKMWGTALLGRLNGMFAFAAYDRRAGILLLARDRFGEKPLFWSRNEHCFAFASEIPALTRHPSLAGQEIDRESIMKFFAFGLFPGSTTPWRHPTAAAMRLA